MKGFATAVLALGVIASPLLAQEVPAEVQELGKQQVTVHVHPFLSGEELSALRLVATNEQALALFVTRPGRFTAIAVAPGEGFIRDGQPVPSATALSDLPDAETARADATAACNAARTKGPDCVVVLEVAPAK